MTAVSGATFTASQFNQYVRDNLNETAPAKATAPSQLFVSTGPNAIATRTPTQQYVQTAETRSSTLYGDLATPGPMVTVTTGTIAIVHFACGIANSVNDSACFVSVDVTGVSTVAASDGWAIGSDGITAGNFVRYGMTHVFTGLTPGTNVFTMRYRAASNTGTFRQRELAVIPL